MKRTPLPASNALVLENGMLKLAPPGSTTIQKDKQKNQQDQRQQKQQQHKSEPQLNVRDDEEAPGDREGCNGGVASPLSDQSMSVAVQQLKREAEASMPFYQNIYQVHGGYPATASSTLHQSHENIYTDLSGPYALYTPENIYPHLMPQNFMQAQKRRMPRSSSGGSVLV